MEDKSKSTNTGKSRKRKRWRGDGSNRRHYRRKTKPGTNPGSRVSPGGRVILITCTEGKEAQSAREVRDWMSQAADDWYPRAKGANAAGSGAAGSGAAGESSSVADALEAELRELREQSKDAKAASTTSNRFTIEPLDGRALAMLRVRDPAIPVETLVTRMMRGLLASGERRTRYTHRVLPLSHTCFSKPETFEKAAQKGVEQHLAESGAPPKSFAVFFRSRSKNASMKRMVCIDTVFSCFPKGTAVDLCSPDLTVLVQVIGRITGIGFVEGFEELGQYNVETLLKRAGEDAKTTGASIETGVDKAAPSGQE